MPIEKLELTPRAYNSLKRANISKVGEVLEMSEEELLAVRNFGKKSLDELRDRSSQNGLLAEAQGSPLVQSSGSANLFADLDDQDEEEDLNEASTCRQEVRPAHRSTRGAVPQPDRGAAACTSGSPPPRLRAKAIRRHAEKLITLARQPTIHHRRLAMAAAAAQGGGGAAVQARSARA